MHPPGLRGEPEKHGSTEVQALRAVLPVRPPVVVAGGVSRAPAPCGAVTRKRLRVQVGQLNPFPPINPGAPLYAQVRGLQGFHFFVIPLPKCKIIRALRPLHFKIIAATGAYWG